MSRQKRQPEKIQNLVWNVLRNKGYETPVKEQQVVQHWPQIVGEKIAEQTQAVAVENRCLFVKVKSASWQNELVFLKGEIIKKANNFAGKKVVKNIIFTR